jgi:GWxTD domain-containing protein
MKKLFLTLLTLGYAVFTASAQDTGRKTRNVIPEIKPVYKEWLEKDVCVIVTRDPRKDYLKLETDEEREKFIDDYWRRLEQDPEIAAKNERVERVTYADEHFTVGTLGSRTDRGRIYILWGGPDKTVHGRMRMAGRDESVRFEIWTCDTQTFTFIDPEGTGDFRLIREEEKMKITVRTGSGTDRFRVGSYGFVITDLKNRSRLRTHHSHS